MYRITVRIPDLRALGLKLVPSDEDMAHLGRDAVQTMVKRTQEGKDVDGTLFAPYSRKYLDKKSKEGRYRGFVNLTWDGDMLQGMVVSQIPRGVRISFANRKEIASYHQQGAGHLPERRFFGLSEAEMSKLARMLSDRIRARMR